MIETEMDRARARRLALYSAAAGGVMFSAAALAAPMPIDAGALRDITVTNDGDNGSLDLDGDSVNDFGYSVGDTTGPPNYRSVWFYGQVGQNGFAVLPLGNPDCSSSDYAGDLAPGTVVSGAMNFVSSDSLYAHFEGDLCTHYTSGQAGRLGIRFERAGNLHYGYLLVRMTEGSMRFEVLGGEWESVADTPIVVPQAQHNEVTPVPVGGAIPIALSVLALGAAALRRRQKKLH